MKYLQQLDLNMSFKKDKWLDFYNSNKFALMALIPVVLACYLFAMTNFSLSIDEQGRYGTAVYVGLSRYGTLPLKYLFGSIPVFGTYLDILCVIFLTAFSVIMAQEYFTLNAKKMNPFFIFLFMAMIVSFPFNANYIVFATYSFEVSVGLCLSALALKYANSFIKDRVIFHFVYSVFFLGFAISIYQSLISIFFVGVSFSLYFIFAKNDEIDVFKPFFIAIGKNVAILISSYVVYSIGDFGFRKYFNIFGKGYVDSFIKWGTEPIIETAKLLISKLINILVGGTYYDFRMYIMPTSAIIIAALIVFSIFTKRRNKLIAVICLIGFAVAPFLVSIALGNVVPVRALQGVGLSIAGVWLIAGETVISLPILKKSLIVVAICFIMFASRATSNLLFSEYMVLEQERDLIVKITDRIERLGYGEIPEYPVILKGYRSTRKTPNMYDGENLGTMSSMFNHASFIGLAFMKHFGYDYVPPTQEQIDSVPELSAAMPPWPNEGSVELKDGIIIVKFG